MPQAWRWQRRQRSPRIPAKKPNVPLEKTIGTVTPTGPVPSLAVINSAGAKLDGGKLVLTGVSANSIVFADRPVRAAGHVATEQFIMQWDEGKDNFAIDPPNATVSVLGGDGSGVSDAVVTLKSPKLDGGNLTFDVTVLEGSLDGGSGQQRFSSIISVEASAAAADLAEAVSVEADLRGVELWRRRLPWRRLCCRRFPWRLRPCR